MRKQRVAMKKDLQRKLDHWDKDTDKSRYYNYFNCMRSNLLYTRMKTHILSSIIMYLIIISGTIGLLCSTQLDAFATIGL